jgi:integrase
MANMVVRIMRLLMAYAVDNDYRKDNPAQRLQTFKLGEWRAWSDDECFAFEARWPSGSMQRRANMLAKFTGQRCGDLAHMTRSHSMDGAIRVVQQKTGADLWIPEHRALNAELAIGVQHISLLTKADGSSFDSDTLSRWFADAIQKAGLPEPCVLHGLRKTAARMLAEVGCSTHEIASITGHRSLKEVERYTEAANQRTLATAAIHKLERNAIGTPIAKRDRTLSAKRTLGD